MSQYNRTILLLTSNFVPLTNLLTTCKGVRSNRKEELLCSQLDISRQKLSFVDCIREESKGLSFVHQITSYYAFKSLHIFPFLKTYIFKCVNIVCINII